MTDREKKAVIHEEVPGAGVSIALLSFGYLEPLIELLQSDREIPRMVRVVLRDMLKADPSKQFHLVCKPNKPKRGRGSPPKSIEKRVRDFEMGCRVWYLMDNDKKYEVAIRVVAKEFGVSPSLVEKAYTSMNKAYEDSVARGHVPPRGEV